MAKKKQSIKSTSKNRISKTIISKQFRTVLGSFFILFGVFLAIAFISFYFNWQEDQSTINKIFDKSVLPKNLLGKIGANLSNFYIYKGFGIAAFIICYKLILTGAYILIQKKFSRLIVSWNWGLLTMIWLSITLAFLSDKYALLSGVIGFEVNQFLQSYLGKVGLIITMIFLGVSYFAVRYKITFDRLIDYIKAKRATSSASALEEKLTDDTENTSV